MAVLSFGEIWAGRTGDKDNKFRRQYVRRFRAVVSNRFDGPVTIWAHPNCPGLFDGYVNGNGTESDPEALCRSLTPSQNDPNSPLVWEIEAKYDTSTDDPARSDPNPLNRPADISASFEESQVAMEKDLDGKMIGNSAKLPHNPPPSFDDGRQILIYTKNEPVYLFSNAQLYQNATNSDVFLGAAPGTVKMRSRSERQFENGVTFFRNTYEFRYNEKGWNFAPLDRGKAELIQGKHFAIKEKGVTVPDEVLLDGNGNVLYPRAPRTTTLNGATGAGNGIITVEKGSGERFIPGRKVNGVDVSSVAFSIDNEDMLFDRIVEGLPADKDVWKITRGVNGTVAAAHADKAIITQKTGAASVLILDVNATLLSIEVYDAGCFGLRPPFSILVDDEEMLVTAMNKIVFTKLTVTRGYNGTTAAAHVTGTVVQQAPVYLFNRVCKSLPFALLGIV